MGNSTVVTCTMSLASSTTEVETKMMMIHVRLYRMRSVMERNILA